MTETLTDTPARNYVGGEWLEAGSGETYEKRDPWRPSTVTGVFQSSSADDAHGAVAAAATAPWASSADEDWNTPVTVEGRHGLRFS